MTVPAVPIPIRVSLPAVPFAHPEFADLQAIATMVALLIARPDAPPRERAEWATAAAGWLAGVAGRENRKRNRS